jgi:bacteriocin-like protein
VRNDEINSCKNKSLGETSREEAKIELTEKELSQVTGGSFFKNCCSGRHYDTVTIEMR